MKPHWQKQRNGAMTMVEVLVVVAVLVLLAAIVLPLTVAHGCACGTVNCVSNVKQVDLSFRIWEGDNNNEYPMAVSTSLGGAMELVAANNVAACFQVMSNELSTPKILICPKDTVHRAAANFDDDFNNSHLSYFLGVDATNEMNPARILIGDDNFEINGSAISSGLLSLPTNAPVAWAPGRHDDPSRIPLLRIPTRHYFYGNIGYADGSVVSVTTLNLQRILIQTGLATNRLAIP